MHCDRKEEVEEEDKCTMRERKRKRTCIAKEELREGRQVRLEEKHEVEGKCTRKEKQWPHLRQGGQVHFQERTIVPGEEGDRCTKRGRGGG